MAKTCYMLAATIAASTNDAAHVDIQGNGTLIGIAIDILNTTAAPAAGDYLLAQVSTNSVLQTTNDSNGVMANLPVSTHLPGAQGGPGGSSAALFLGPLSIPVKAGDRIYLNASEAGVSTYTVRVIIFVR